MYPRPPGRDVEFGIRVVAEEFDGVRLHQWAPVTRSQSHNTSRVAPPHAETFLAGFDAGERQLPAPSRPASRHDLRHRAASVADGAAFGMHPSHLAPGRGDAILHVVVGAGCERGLEAAGDEAAIVGVRARHDRVDGERRDGVESESSRQRGEN
jgi:hypothetical protein